MWLSLKIMRLSLLYGLVVRNLNSSDDQINTSETYLGSQFDHGHNSDKQKQ